MKCISDCHYIVYLYGCYLLPVEETPHFLAVNRLKPWPHDAMGLDLFLPIPQNNHDFIVALALILEL